MKDSSFIPCCLLCSSIFLVIRWSLSASPGCPDLESHASSFLFQSRVLGIVGLSTSFSPAIIIGHVRQLSNLLLKAVLLVSLRAHSPPLSLASTPSLFLVFVTVKGLSSYSSAFHASSFVVLGPFQHSHQFYSSIKVKLSGLVGLLVWF